MPLHFGINQHKLFLTRFLSPRIRHLSPLPRPSLPHTCLFTIPENCTPFSDTRACFPSRQQFSQNYSCIRYNTLALHDDVLICHSRDSDNNYSTTSYPTSPSLFHIWDPQICGSGCQSPQEWMIHYWLILNWINPKSQTFHNNVTCERWRPKFCFCALDLDFPKKIRQDYVMVRHQLHGNEDFSCILAQL